MVVRHNQGEGRERQQDAEVGVGPRLNVCSRCLTPPIKSVTPTLPFMMIMITARSVSRIRVGLGPPRRTTAEIATISIEVW